MVIDTWAVVFATLLGPILAVQAQRVVAERGEARQRQVTLFRALMKTRVASLSPEHVDALNAVAIEFHKDKSILSKWRIYFDHLNSRGMALEVWLPKRLELFVELLSAMATKLKYDFDPLQIKNEVYSPEAHAQIESDQELIRRGVVALLKGEITLPMEVRHFAINEEALAAQRAVQDLAAAWLRGEVVPRVKVEGEQAKHDAR